MVIDNKLSWKDHISFVCRKVARGIGVIIKARKVLHNESLKCLYYSFIYGFFTKNSNIHVHDTRQKCHYHLPLCRTNLGKCGLRYVGASIWNNILSVNINPNVSEFIFSRSLKAAICNNLL